MGGDVARGRVLYPATAPGARGQFQFSLANYPLLLQARNVFTGRKFAGIWAIAAVEGRMMRILADRLIACGLLVAVGISPLHAEALDTTAGPVSGKFTSIGEQMRRGAEMAVAGINADGSAPDQNVRLIVAGPAADRALVTRFSGRADEPSSIGHGRPFPTTGDGTEGSTLRANAKIQVLVAVCRTSECLLEGRAR